MTYAYINKSDNTVKFTIETTLAYDINSNLDDTVYCIKTDSELNLLNYNYEYINKQFVSTAKEKFNLNN